MAVVGYICDLLLIIEKVLGALAADSCEREDCIAKHFQSFGHSLRLFVAPFAQNVVYLVAASEVATDTEADA